MFEIVFHYYKRLETGKYDSEDHTMKKTIGKKDEEIPLETLASFIVGYLARRDIWITDVECYEFVKKKVPFKETRGGILLSSKKFTLDGSKVLDGVDIVAEEDKVEQVQPILKQNVSKVASVAPTKHKFLRYEIFAGDIDGNLRVRGLTKGKKYGIIKEVTGGIKNEVVHAYIVLNDSGNEMRVDPVYFTADIPGIPDAFKQGSESTNSGGVVYAGEVITQDMAPMQRR